MKHSKHIRAITSMVLVALCLVALLALSGCMGSTGANDVNNPANSENATTESASASTTNATGNNASSATDAASGAIAADARAATPATADASQRNLSPAEGELLVRFIDVGQGDCTLVSCNGHHLLIDGGPAKQSSKVYAILKTLGITSLDAIIATHSDADHIGGISGALNFADAGVCYCSVTEADTKTFNSIVKYLDQKGCPLKVPQVGDSFVLGCATVTFVGPARSFSDDNDTSLVCRIDFGETSFLLTGDAEEESESAMVYAHSDLKADVLKVSHHGSKNASTDVFLKTVAPTYAVISVGKNSYGHPADTTLERLANVGAEILRTDEIGSITFTSDGTTLTYESSSRITR